MEIKLDSELFDSKRFWKMLNDLPFPAGLRKAIGARAKAIGVSDDES